MGTRNLTIVVDKKGNLKVAQYGQWDGYPSGQGVRTLEFARDKSKLKLLEQTLDNCKFYNECNDIERWLYGYEERTRIEYDSHISTDSRKINGRNDRDVYWWDFLQSRDIGANILQNICYVDTRRLPNEHNNYIYLFNDMEFGKNSLMCEYAYCINLKENKLQCFIGFNKDKTKEYELFKTNQEEIDEEYKDTNYKYYGLELLNEYDLDNLPSYQGFIDELNYLEDKRYKENNEE
jgi:hypothetical protein